MPENTFLFVSVDGTKPSRDAKTRRRIKQQVMKKAATARKQTGSYGQHNRRQLPVFIKDDVEHKCYPSLATISPDGATESSNHHSARTPDQALVKSRLVRRTSLSPLLSDKSSPRNFSILLKIMPLMGLRLGVATIPHLIPDPDQAAELSWLSQSGGRKFLSFIPSRYDHVPSLRYATDCVIARLEQLMLPAEKRTAQTNITVLVRYQAALKELQMALDNEEDRTSAETLCATQLLGVFETLNGGTSSDLWIRHVIGASKLIEARGAQRFETEFERSLLVAHMGPTVMAAFLDNSPCFLAGEQWQRVMRSAVLDDKLWTGERDLVVMLWRSLVNLPAVFKDATDLLLSPSRPSPASKEAVINRLVTTRENLIKWLAMLRETTPHIMSAFQECSYGLAKLLPGPNSHKIGKHHLNQLALRGTYAVCRMIKSRLLFALDPIRFRELEAEAQSIAQIVSNVHIQNLHEQKERLSWDMFMSQSSWIAKAIIDTRDLWEADYTTHMGMIESWKFEVWNKTIGRRCG